MGIFGLLGAAKPVAHVALKVLNLVDPKTRNLVNMRKAINFGEKYIFKTEEIEKLNGEKLTSPEVKKLARLIKKRKYYRRWYFEYS